MSFNIIFIWLDKTRGQDVTLSVGYKSWSISALDHVGVFALIGHLILYTCHKLTGQAQRVHADCVFNISHTPHRYYSVAKEV
jgi:hypothetical protein